MDEGPQLPEPAEPKRHVRRKMTPQEKLDYRRRRLLRACKECASSKRKCNHDLSNQNFGVIKPDPSAIPPHRYTESRNGLTTPSQTPPDDLVYFRSHVREGIADQLHEVLGDKLLSYSQRSHGDEPKVISDEISLSLHKPQSPEMLSAILFVDNINCEGVADAWFNEVPARLGDDPCLDQAIAALQMTCWYRRRLPGATLPEVYRALASALEALQLSMCSDGAALDDHTLASVAALSPVEAIRAGNTFLVPTHLDGLTSILVSRAALAPLSEMARRILEYHFCDTYVMASIRGLVSPLESLDRMYCDPCDILRPSAERKIRAIGNELCVNLPRLIALVRMVCEQHTSSVTVSSALSLIGELLRLENEKAENEYLYYVGTAKTAQAVNFEISEYSLQFQAISSFEAGLYYWHTRSTALRLCRRLRAFFGTMCNVYSLPTDLEIKEELERCASNILKTAEFAQTLTARKRRRLFGQSLIACWGIYKDYPDIFSSDEQLKSVRTWLVESLNMILLGSNSALTEQDMDDAAELFAGGPLRGMYKTLYDPT